MELTVATAVLAVLLASTTKMISVASDYVRLNERRSTALQAIQAVAEEIENIPWDSLDQESASEVAIPAALVGRLPGLKLATLVNNETDPVAKRVSVELTWNGRGAQQAGPVRLTIWSFPENRPVAQ
jgi:hypothetical protein